MKRLVFASLISLLALSAQATTIDWGKATSGQANHAYTGQTSANHLSDKLNSATTWTVGAVLTVKGDIGTLTGWPSIIGVTKTSDSDSAFRFVLNNGTAGTVGISTPGSVVSASGDPVTLETGKSYEFVISHSADNTLAFYIDGVLYGSATVDETFTNIVWGKQGTSSANNPLWGDGRENAFTMDVYYSTEGDYAALKEKYSPEPIPEPMALALLALGVAGVALRRKVA